MLQPPRRRGRPPRYPWDTWLDGERRLLVPGEDFPLNANLDTFRVQIYNAARSRGIGVKVEKYGGGFIVRASRSRKGTRGRPEAYNWDHLLNGDAHRLRRRFDFDGEPRNFAATARTAARRRGLRAVVNVDGDEVQLVAFKVQKPRPMVNLVPDEELECWDEPMDRDDFLAMVELDAEDLIELLKDSNVLESLSSPSATGERPEAMTPATSETLEADQEVDNGDARAATSAERGASAN